MVIVLLDPLEGHTCHLLRLNRIFLLRIALDGDLPGSEDRLASLAERRLDFVLDRTVKVLVAGLSFCHVVSLLIMTE